MNCPKCNTEIYKASCRNAENEFGEYYHTTYIECHNIECDFEWEYSTWGEVEQMDIMEVAESEFKDHYR